MTTTLKKNLALTLAEHDQVQQKLFDDIREQIKATCTSKVLFNLLQPDPASLIGLAKLGQHVVMGKIAEWLANGEIEE